jgi:hypothetical protein
MVYRTTRQELYEKVWLKPLTHVAKDFEVTGTALKKACNKYCIPTPGRGYWARHRHGKVDPKIPLPPRGPGLGNDIKIGGRAYWHYHISNEEILSTPIGPEPAFDEDIKVVRRRAGSLIGEDPVPVDLSRCHRLLVKYLENDKARRKTHLNSRFPSDWDRPLFDGAFEQRRLTIINGLYTLLSRADMRPCISKSHAVDLGCMVGETYIGLRLDSPGRINDDRGHWGPRDEPEKPTMRFEIESGKKIVGVRTVWQDGRGTRIEKSIRTIATEILVAGEMLHRRHAVSHHAWRVKRRANLEEEIRQAREEAIRKEAERIERLEAARIMHLMDLGERHRKAADMRQMISVLAETGRAGLPEKELETWQTWARAEADRIDPVTSGALAGSVANRDAGVDPALLVTTPGLPGSDKV